MLPTTWGKMLSIKPKSTLIKVFHGITALSSTVSCMLSGWPGKDEVEIKMCLETALGLVHLWQHTLLKKKTCFKSKRLIPYFHLQALKKSNTVWSTDTMKPLI